ncbi:hypothetical protein ACQR14_33345, partial [Bradyrhizobium oligotrophicum]
MADWGVRLRRVVLVGPRTGKDSFLWTARLSTAFSRGSVPAPTAGVRVLLQSDRTAKLSPAALWASGGNDQVDFHVPQLLQFTLRGEYNEPDHNSDEPFDRDRLSLINAAPQRLKTLSSAGLKPFATPTAVPVFRGDAGSADWPSQHLWEPDSHGEIEVPPFQLTDGRIPVCITGERND